MKKNILPAILLGALIAFSAGFVVGYTSTPDKAHAQVGGSAVGAGNYFRQLGSAVSTVVSSLYLGIGTSTPNSKFTVQGTSGSTADVFNVASSTGTSMLRVGYDGAVSVPGALTVGSCVGCAGSIALNDLSDVVITAAAYGDSLMFDGANWADTATSTLFGQNLTSAGSPAFTGLSVNGHTLTVNGIATLNDWFDQSVKVAASPSFAGLTLGTLTGLLKGTTGVVSVATAGTDYAGLTSNNNHTSGLNSFATASSSLASIVQGWFGGTATTTIGSNGYVNVAGASTTPQRAIVYNTASCNESTLTDGATVTWDLSVSSCARVLLGGNRTLDITNASQAIGQTVRLVACANGGAYTFTGWDTLIRWPAKTAPTQTGADGSCDVFTGFVSSASSTPVVIMGASLNF